MSVKNNRFTPENNHIDDNATRGATNKPELCCHLYRDIIPSIYKIFYLSKQSSQHCRDLVSQWITTDCTDNKNIVDEPTVRRRMLSIKKKQDDGSLGLDIDRLRGIRGFVHLGPVYKCGFA